MISTVAQEISRKYALPHADAIQKIVVLMYGLLGDTLIRTPLLRELRRLYPNACIVTFVDPSGRDALSLTDLTDRVIVLNRKKKALRFDIFSRVTHFFQLRLESADLVIDTYMGRTSQLMAKYSGAQFKIFAGFEETTSNWGLRRLLIPQFVFGNPHHICNSFLNSLAFLTRDPINLSTQPALDIVRLSAIKNQQSRVNKLNNQKFFLVSLGAGDPKKIPETTKVKEICKYIYDRNGLIPVIIKNPRQEYLQESLVNKLEICNVPVKPLPLLNVKQVATLMLEAKFVMVPDSGLFHIAVGLGINTLAFFTHTNPELVRPTARNCIIVFEAREESVSHNRLPCGNGTPSTAKLLATVSGFLNDLDN
jgi:ADP-heptose:LPS heptosyltransferase